MSDSEEQDTQQLEEQEDDEEETVPQLSKDQKIDIAKWFLLNSPPGEIQYVAKDLRSVLNDENVYGLAASQAFPIYNKSHIVSLQLPNRSGDVLISSFSEVSQDEYLDPRTAQVGKVDHVRQICTQMRPARDDELPSQYVEEYRCAVDAEISKYVGEAYSKGVFSVYCTSGKEVEEPGSDFELVVVITATRHSPQNFCNGNWISIWNIEFKDELQTVEIRGKMQVGAHYFEEGNVQLDAKHECRDSTIFQVLHAKPLSEGSNHASLIHGGFMVDRCFSGAIAMRVAGIAKSPDDSAISLTEIIRHHESEYLTSLQASYSNLPDSTFKELRRKLPVTRTLFPWHNTMQFSLTRDLTKELGIGK